MPSQNLRLRLARERTESPSHAGECLSRQELAELVSATIWKNHQKRVDLAANYIGKLERGVIRWPGQLCREALRAVLGANSDRQLGFDNPRRNTKPITDAFPPAESWSGLPSTEPGLLRLASAGTPLAALPATPQVDSDYLESVRQHIWHIVELDNRFGGSDLADLTVRCFRALHHLLGTGAYQPAVERDLQAIVGELAEVAGWLLYDADRQEDVRRMNHEALYFSRLAGDRQMELLTTQNSSMHAGFLGHPLEALHLADSVLESGDRLTPRVKTLFLIRKARALAQGGDGAALRLFDAVRSHFQDGIRDTDPKWAWWVDERELAWHEGMAQLHLGRADVALEMFERSVAATAPHQVRSRYLHLSYLLGAQTRVGALRDAEATLHQLAPLANEVASRRTVMLLRKSLPKLCEPGVPISTREAAEQLRHVLT